MDKWHGLTMDDIRKLEEETKRELDEVKHVHIIKLRRVWRYQRDNQNPYIEEGQTTQWQKEKGQKDKQRSTKHTHKTKDWANEPH